MIGHGNHTKGYVVYKLSANRAAGIFGLSLVALAASPAVARDQISIVGSSTVFPFSTTVAERLGKNTDVKTPVVESTGSGGGLKLFCASVGEDSPDITNASRRIKSSEIETCASNGVTEIVEAKVGYDGIVFANSVDGDLIDVSQKDLFLALAKMVPDGNGGTMPNPNMTWDQVNSNLPAIKIEVLGPPPTSGTRDAFVELVMDEGCEEFEEIKALKKSDKDAFKALCRTIREDGAYVEAGENDNLVVQKLQANPTAFGIFGFSFLDQNSDVIEGNLINGVEPTFEAISSGEYPVSRSLYFYVKKAHVGEIPGIEDYLAEFTSEEAWGPEGYLADKGLIPLPAADREQVKNSARGLQSLSM